MGVRTRGLDIATNAKRQVADAGPGHRLPLVARRQDHPNNRPPTRATAISEMGQCTKSLRDSPLRGGLREAQ
jgi:hypothetical protein